MGCPDRDTLIPLTMYIVLRDVRERGRDIEGIIKQWFEFVKPSYTRFVEPQRPISGWYMSLRSVRDFLLTLNLRHHYPAWY